MALLYGMTGNALGRIALVFSPHTAVVGIIRGLTNHAHVSPLRMWVDRATMPLVDRYISNSRFVMEELRRWRFPEKKLCVCHTGIDPRPFLEASAREEARAALHLSTEGLVVLCVASLRPVKNHPFLLDVCERLWRRGSRFTLLLAGTGPDEKKLRERAGKSDWSDRIRFLGLFDEVPMLLAASDIFVLASHSEGLPRSIMEAMASGLPVVASEVGGVRELVVEEETGSLVAPGKAVEFARKLEKLLESASYRERLGAAGRRRVMDHFSIEREVRKFEVILEEIAAQR